MGLLDNLGGLSESPNMALAMGLLSAAGPQARPVSMGQALGQGMGEMRQAKQEQMHSLMRNIQIGEVLRKQQEAERQQAQLSAFRNSLPEQDRGLFDVAPHEFIKNMPRFQPMKEVEIADPVDPLRTQKQWIRPGETSGIPIGYGKMPEILDPRVQEARKLIAKAGAPSVSVSTDSLGLKPKDRFEMEDKLRGDYTKATDLENKIIGTSGKMRAVLSGDPNAIKDQAAIYSFAKLLDPDGAVRESDYAAITNTAGLVDRLKNYSNKLMTGQMLNPQQRAEMMGVMDQWEKIARGKVGTQQKTYSSRAKMYNLVPENVFQPLDAMPDASDARPPLSSFGGR